MCGICGFTGSPRDAVLAAMNQEIRHRGPDDEGYARLDGVSFAMKRLSIVDLDSGQQPQFNEDRSICVICNGEIYDYRSHRRVLEQKGHIFCTDHSDTEVIVHLYEEYGEDWVSKVNGMFGVAVWDSRCRTLLLYRDRLGKKPLYYANKNGRLIFGSEIKAVLADPDISREPDYVALFSYFGLKNISAPRSAFAEISQLMPGQMLRFRDGGLSLRNYWKIDMAHVRRDITVNEAADRLLDLLDNAVKLRMDCDVPYGAYLSGGVDSSSVVVLMKRHCKNALKTFCLGYAKSVQEQCIGKQYDIEYARLMSKRLHTEHYEYILHPGDFAGGMESVISAFDEPFSGTCSTYFLTPLIRSHVKVALSGDGADELFGSYLAHRIAFPLESMKSFIAQGITVWDEIGDEQRNALKPFDTREGFEYLFSIVGKDAWSWRDKLCVFTLAERQKLLSREFLTQAGMPQDDYPFSEIKKTLTGHDALNRVLEWDQRELLANQVLPFVDRLSMAHSLEVRSPYMDYRVVEFANSLPGMLKIRGGINKYVHKRAMASLLPADLLHRPKEGFVQPNYFWMHGELKDWAVQQLRDLPAEWFRREYINELIAGFATGSRENDAKLWNLICFSIWYKLYVV